MFPKERRNTMKVLDEIRAQLTGRKFSSTKGPTDLVEVMQKIEKPDLDCLLEYEVAVKIGLKIKCKEEDLHEAKENVIHTIRQLIYGELLMRLLYIERTVFEEDLTKAKAEIKSLIQELYKPL